MFSIVITDKGGAQRRLESSKGEITIGRVQGNDIILPKGNVSKRHSRIVLKDNRYIVVDLKSTNGTYVNGRKITSPLVIRPNDKIYIGDFILTLEDTALATDQARGSMSSNPPPLPPKTESSSPAAIASEPASAMGTVPAEAAQGSREVPQTAMHASHASGSSAPSSVPARAANDIPQANEELGNTSAGGETNGASVAPAASAGAKNAASALLQARSGTASVAADAAMSSTLLRVMGRLAQSFDIYNVSPSQRFDSSLRDRVQNSVQSIVASMESQGELPVDRPAGQLVQAALQEAVGLGALEPILADSSVQEAIVESPVRVLTDSGAGLQASNYFFSSPGAVRTAVARLFAEQGLTLPTQQATAQTTLRNGRQIEVVLSPMSVGCPIVHVRSGRVAPTVEQLMSLGVLDASVLHAVRAAMSQRRGVGVIGVADAGVTQLLSCFARMIDGNERVVALKAQPDMPLLGSRILMLRSTSVFGGFKAALEQAVALHPDRLIIDDLRGDDLFPALVTSAARGRGDLLGVETAGGQDPLNTLTGLVRLGAERDPQAVQRLIAQALSVIVHVTRADTGFRVAGVSELLTQGNIVQLQPLVAWDRGFRQVASASFAAA